MNFFTRFGGAFMTAINSFLYTYSSSANPTTYESFNARKSRQELYWAFYEAMQYDYSGAQSLRNQRGLYKYIQDIYNPTRRLGDFYKGVVWRGSIDQEAGETGAIPIEVGKDVNEQQLRAAISHVWQISNWNINKNIHVLRGTILGDSVKIIRDDMEHEECRIELLHPSSIKSVERDGRGYVKGYVMEETRLDNEGRGATYREVCTRGENDDVVFKTYRNDTVYAWDGNNDKNGDPVWTWTEPYGFIPLVLTQHINIGMDWGSSEIAAAFGKFAVVDDEASMLHDKVRQSLDPFILANFKKPSSDLTAANPTATTDKPQPGRETQKIIYVDKEGVSMTPVVVPLDIAGVSANIKQMLDNLEKEFPELREDVTTSNVATDTVLAARSRVESKVNERRVNYDTGMVQANQMSVAIGGWRGYKGFEGFNLDSFAAGKLDHSIKERPVFPETENQIMEKKIRIWTTAGTVTQQTAGTIPPEVILRDLGASEEVLNEMPTAQINAIKKSQEDVIPTERL